jgi:hypothetical protein
VELLPARASPTADASIAWPTDDPQCEPKPLAVVGVDDHGAIDDTMLRQGLDSARAFAERCCTGDESGDATVRVTAASEGFTTTVAIEPDNLSTGPTGACLHASFHRVTTKAFTGSPVTVIVVVHVRAESASSHPP